MVDLIHPRVRNPILRDVAVRACHVEHEAQAVAIEIADAAKHDVSARPGRHLCSGDGLSPRGAHLCPPLSLALGASPRFSLSISHNTTLPDGRFLNVTTRDVFNSLIFAAMVMTCRDLGPGAGTTTG